MLYNIEYKNYISNNQLKSYSRSFLCPINSRNDEAKINIPLNLSIDKDKKNNDTAKTERIPKLSNYTPIETKNFQVPTFIKGNIQSRRFSATTQAQIGIKRSCFLYAFR